MPRSRVPRAIALALPVVAVLTCATVAGAAEAAREMLDEAKRRNDTTRAWKDREQKLALKIVDGQGRERQRELVMRTLRGQNGEDRTLTVFLKPGEVRGTSFLQFAHKDRDAEQWLYLPAVGRTRQITSSGKNESFVGTDFSYRDLELLTDVLEWSEAEARSNLLSQDNLDGVELATIDLVPTRKDVGYKRIVLTMSLPDLLIRRMEFYRDQEATPQKVLLLEQIKDVGAVPTPHRLEMRQPGRGSRTVVDVSEVTYDKGMKPGLFTQESLVRAGEDPA